MVRSICVHEVGVTPAHPSADPTKRVMRWETVDGHRERSLATVFAALMMLAFAIDRVRHVARDVLAPPPGMAPSHGALYYPG